jgi:hypothetical protein
MESVVVDPAAAAPEASPASDAASTSTYERFEFPSKAQDQPVSSPAAPTEPRETQPTEEPPPSASTTGDDWETIREKYRDRWEKDEAIQQRIEQLVNNRIGNKLQDERRKWEEDRRRESEAWDEATEVFNRLQTDDAYRREQIRLHGEPAVEEFEANYREKAQARRQAPALEAERAKFVEQFNQAATSEFKNIVKATLPIYADLPDDVRATIENLAYDPSGNWFADGLEALGKGIERWKAGIERAHQKALEEAREAGRNDGLASRQESAPVIVKTSTGLSDQEIVDRYVTFDAEGRAVRDPSITREMFRDAMRRLGRGHEL